MNKLLASAVAILALLSTGCMGGHEDADTSRTRLALNGTYEASYAPEVDPVPMRTLHAWTVTIRTADGRPVDDAVITIDGGMPDHGHGLPTQPTVREALGEGRYVIEGVKFNMGGYWIFDLGISSAAGDDTVRFELNL